jgi:hypothetical protein
MEKLVVIGWATKLGCFRSQSIDIRKHPIEWRSDKKTWMTSQIMKEWLTAFIDRMKT